MTTIYARTVKRNGRGAIKDTGAKRLVQKHGTRNFDTKVYLKLPLFIVDFVYEKYPDMSLAGAIEKFLAESANV